MEKWKSKTLPLKIHHGRERRELSKNEGSMRTSLPARNWTSDNTGGVSLERGFSRGRAQRKRTSRNDEGGT